MSLFQVGDRVECIFNHPDGNPNIATGLIGTVCRDNRDGGCVGVRWDDMVSGHNCGGTCTSGHGWYMRSSEIKLYEEDEAVDIDETSFMSMIGGAQ